MIGLSSPEVTHVPSDDPAVFTIRFIASREIPAAVAAQLQPGEMAIEAQVAMKDNLSLVTQVQLIAAAREMLNELEANLKGGIGSRPGQKAVKA